MRRMTSKDDSTLIKRKPMFVEEVPAEILYGVAMLFTDKNVILWIMDDEIWNRVGF
jgi:hypothetical protein